VDAGFGFRKAPVAGAFDSLQIGERIRRLRTDRRLSQRALADFAARSERWMWNVEAGLTTLDYTEAEGLALGLRVDVTVVLGLEDEQMKRREILKAGLGLAGLAAGMGLRGSSLDYLAQVTAQFGSWSLRMPPDLMAPLLDTHQANLATILRASGARPGILRVAAETAILRGEVWLAQGDRPAARRQFRLGEQMAQEAADGSTLAAVYRAQRHVVSLAYIRSGNRTDAGQADHDLM